MCERAPAARAWVRACVWHSVALCQSLVVRVCVGLWVCTGGGSQSSAPNHQCNSGNPMPIHSEVTIKVPQLLPVGVDVAGIPTETPRGSATQLLVARRVFGATCSRLAISNLTQTTDNPCRFNFPPTGYVVRQVMFASHFQPPPPSPPLPSPPLPSPLSMQD